MILASNSGWNGLGDAGEITAITESIGILPLSRTSGDSALLRTLTPGNYSVTLDGSGVEGVGFVEIYQVSAGSPSAWNELSFRGVVGAGENILTAGFVVAEGGSKRVTFRLVDGDEGAGLSIYCGATFLAKTGGAGVTLTLVPGVYSVQASNGGGAAGVGEIVIVEAP